MLLCVPVCVPTLFEILYTVDLYGGPEMNHPERDLDLASSRIWITCLHCHSLSVNVWSWRVSTFDFETDWVWDSRTQATLA